MRRLRPLNAGLLFLLNFKIKVKKMGNARKFLKEKAEKEKKAKKATPYYVNQKKEALTWDEKLKRSELLREYKKGRLFGHRK